ncbi:MAG: hypothetical protein ACFFG0_32760 [Candidatus Thorarchaeota archaeon]
MRINRVKKLIVKGFSSLGFEIKRKKIEKVVSYSHLDEQDIINNYLNKIDLKNKYCVDIGASDGISMSNTFALFKIGWKGVVVECDGEKFLKLASTYKKFTSVNLNKNKISPNNVVNFLKANNAPINFSFLSLDIDGYDYFVLKKILGSFRPCLLCVEINEKIPPPLKFTVKYDPNYTWVTDHFYGQSISQLYELTNKHNYDLVELHYNSAFLIPKEINSGRPLTPKEAYKEGYLEQPDRKEKFPWNNDMEDLLHLPPTEALKFVNKYFEKYKGKFTLN